MFTNRILIPALAGCALAASASAQDSAAASDGSSQAFALSAEAAATLSEAGLELAWAGLSAAGQSAAIIFADELADSEAILDVAADASGRPLPIDPRVIVAGSRPDVPPQPPAGEH